MTHLHIGCVLLASILPVVLTSTSAAAADAPPAHSPSSPEITALIQEGHARNHEGELEAADEVWQRLAELMPDHPAAAAGKTSTQWWHHNFDPETLGVTDRIEALTREAEALARARLANDPDDAEAHFYLGSSLMELGRLYGMTGQIVSAGRTGEKARVHLERALELDPLIVDAYYPLGLYYFYASLAPGFVKWLSFLWFVPTGDADKGIAYLEDVAARGVLHQTDAESVLSSVYSYHVEEKRSVGLQRSRELVRRYPENTAYSFELIESLFLAERYREVIEEASKLEAFPASLPRDTGRATMAKVWRARGELYLGDTEAAWRTLASFGPGEPAEPSWGVQWVSVIRGQIEDARGARGLAMRHYREVKDLGLSPAWSRATALAEQYSDDPFAPPLPQISASPDAAVSSGGGN